MSGIQMVRRVTGLEYQTPILSAIQMNPVYWYSDGYPLKFEGLAYMNETV